MHRRHDKNHSTRWATIEMRPVRRGSDNQGEYPERPQGRDRAYSVLPFAQGLRLQYPAQQLVQHRIQGILHISRVAQCRDSLFAASADSFDSGVLGVLGVLDSGRPLRSARRSAAGFFTAGSALVNFAIALSRIFGLITQALRPLAKNSSASSQGCSVL